MDLTVDPNRHAAAEDGPNSTGIFVRAKVADNKWQSVDIITLDRPVCSHGSARVEATTPGPRTWSAYCWAMDICTSPKAAPHER